MHKYIARIPSQRRCHTQIRIILKMSYRMTSYKYMGKSGESIRNRAEAAAAALFLSFGRRPKGRELLLEPRRREPWKEGHLGRIWDL